MFVSLMVEYFGGDEKMIAALADDKVRMNMPPFCYCLCLPRITLTKYTLQYFGRYSETYLALAWVISFQHLVKKK